MCNQLNQGVCSLHRTNARVSMRTLHAPTAGIDMNVAGSKSSRSCEDEPRIRMRSRVGGLQGLEGSSSEAQTFLRRVFQELVLDICWRLTLGLRAHVSKALTYWQILIDPVRRTRPCPHKSSLENQGLRHRRPRASRCTRVLLGGHLAPRHRHI